jgi:GAF domain-containing protein
MVFSVLPLLLVLPLGSTSRLEALSLALTLFLISFLTAYGLRAWQDEFTRTHGAIREMLDELQSERSILEQRLAERTVGIDRKTEQLRATAYIARKTAEVQDLASLLEMVARLVTDQFGFYHTGIFLINETGDQAVLQAASSEGGQHMIERGHALSVGTQGIVGYVAAQKKPRVALDVGADAVFFNNPDLPRTRSELALPLLVRNRVLGVLDIQSDKPQAFNADDVDVLQTLADQVAIAIENARLLDETHATLVQLEALTSLRTREAWNQKLGQRGRVFTYTPLGLRAEKPSQNGENAVSASILLRGQKIGSISIARKGDAPWSKLDRDLVEEVTNQVGLAIDNIRLLEEATNRARQEQIVGKLAARFSQSLDLDTLLQTAARELGQLPDVSEISVFVGQEAPPASQPKPRSKRNVS